MQKIFENISKYRAALMGIAILWIILHHCYFEIKPSMLIYFPFFKLGAGGVDIFLFLSGFGCYYSLTKNPDIGCFLWRRIKRFFPAIPIFIVYIILTKITSFREILGYFTLANYWLDIRGFGYLSYAFLCYILSPHFYNIITKHCNNIKSQLCFLIFIFILTVPFIADNRIQGIARVPIFLFGMIIGYCSLNNQKYSKIIFKVSCILSIIAFINLILVFTVLPESLKYIHKAIYFYNLSLFVPGFCFLTALIFDYTKNNRIIQILSFIGERSLEIFLIDSLITGLYREQIGNIWHISLSIGFGYLYSELYKIVSKKLWVKKYENK